jgi:hypothetical protein
LPCGTRKGTFGNLTLCSHKEKVSIIYYLLLALHNEGSCSSIFGQAQTKQKRRYSTFLTRKRIKEWQKVNNQGKACKRKKPTDEIGQLFCVLANSEGHDDEEEKLGETAFQNRKDNKKDEEEKVPKSAFPYHKDLLFGMDHNDKVPFDCKDKSIELICDNLNCHGFGFLLHEDLDEIQLNLLMIASWSILWSLHAKTDQFPNKDSIEVLSIHHDTQAMFASVLPSEDGGEIAKPTLLEATCKG